MDFRLLIKAGIRQGEFAKLVGVSRVTVNKWSLYAGGVSPAHADTVERTLNKIEAAIKADDLPLTQGLTQKHRMEKLRAILADNIDT